MTITTPETAQTKSTDTPEVAHIIWADDPGAAITQAIVEAIPLEALCGVIFIPSRDASSLPVCEPCKEIKEQIQQSMNPDT